MSSPAPPAPSLTSAAPKADASAPSVAKPDMLAPAPAAAVSPPAPAEAKRLGAPKPPAASAEAPPTPPRPGSLAALLADPSVKGDKPAAFASLYAAWGLDFDVAKHALGCERGRSEGLRCLFGVGSLAKLRRINLPAILDLGHPKPSRRYATLVAVDERNATLDMGGRRLTFPASEVESQWDGSFILLWRGPAVGGPLMQTGQKNAEVVWVRERLGEIDGAPMEEKNRDVYDAELRSRVIAFQRSRSLVPDGIVGEETLVHLSFASRDAGVPRIVSAGS